MDGCSFLCFFCGAFLSSKSSFDVRCHRSSFCTDSRVSFVVFRIFGANTTVLLR